MLELTALVLTYNERENIERTLAALGWVERVLIVDSFSTDDTCERAKGFGNIDIVQRRFDSHTGQWNFGLAQVQTEWVLTLDADYEVSAELAREIQALEPAPLLAGYSARFEFRIFGRKLRASVYPPRTILFRKARATYRDDGHTQLLAADGPVNALSAFVIHDDRKPLSRWIASQDRYTLIEARHLLATPREQLSAQDRLRLSIYFAPPIMFLYLLFGRGLIVGGWPAWYYVAQRTIAELLLSLRLVTERENLERP